VKVLQIMQYYSGKASKIYASLYKLVDCRESPVFCQFSRRFGVLLKPTVRKSPVRIRPTRPTEKPESDVFPNILQLFRADLHIQAFRAPRQKGPDFNT
jgi:hypothetical protein